MGRNSRIGSVWRAIRADCRVAESRKGNHPCFGWAPCARRESQRHSAALTNDSTVSRLDLDDAVLDGEVNQLGIALKFQRIHQLIFVILDGSR